MEHLPRFFRCLEIFASTGAPLQAWRAECGDAFVVAKHLVAPTDRLLRCVPGDLPHFPEMRVVEHSDGRFIAVCDEGISVRRILSRDDLVLHGVQAPRLRAALKLALGLDGSVDAERPLLGSTAVGEVRGAPAAFHPVLLLVSRSSADLLELVGAATNGAPARVLLTPSRKNWSLAVQELVASRRSVIVDLADVIGWRDGALVALQAWRDCLSRLGAGVQPIVAPMESPLADGVVGTRGFRLNGVEYICELRPQERRFLTAALCQDETPIDVLMRPRTGVVWKHRYTRGRRDLISQLVTRVNLALTHATPRVGFTFHLAHGADVVQRRWTPAPAPLTIG